MSRTRTQAEMRAVLSQWDKGDLAPLTQQQQNSWMDLAANADKRPIPNLPGDSNVPKTPFKEVSIDPSISTPSFPPHNQSACRCPLPNDRTSAMTSMHRSRRAAMPPLQAPSSAQSSDAASAEALALEKIETSQQFFNWFGAIEAQMEEEQESSFKKYHETLNKYSGRCADVLEEIDTATTFLQTIEKQYLSASGKTNALHQACEQLVQEQTDLVTFNESISERLSYFVELEGLTQKMNSPTLSVLNDRFIPMLGRLDECINYVGKHQHYKEAPLYLARFRQCQNRAMSLVKIHVVNTLKAATKNVSTQVQNTGDGSEQSFTLFYGKFRMHAPRIKMLMQEIDRRAEHNADFAALLQDCYACYYEQRTALLSGPLAKTMEDITKAHVNDLPSFVRAGCAHMVRVCCNEHQLYQHFFHTIDVGLDDFLEGLASILYDICRPMFINTAASIDTLVELCSVLRVEALDNKGEEVAAFASVAEQMLEDVQQRLCYRTQAFISSTIASFVPTPKDLDYPKIFVQNGGSPAPAPAAVQAAGAEAPAEANGSENGNGAEAEAPSEPQPAVSPAPDTPLINPTWYPTVSRTLVLLSKLYRSVQRPAFQALSQELMNACLESLAAAEVTVTAKAGKTNGQLFMIMHLLILREQIAPFDVEFTKTEKFLDFAGFLGSLKGAATDLYATQQSTGLLTDGGAAFLSFLQRTTPKILETKEDSRLDMETKLKNICMAFMQAASRTMTAPLQSFLVKVDALGEDAKKTLSAQAFATPEKVRALVAETTGQMRTQMASVTKSTSVYLDTKTVKILLDQIQANTVAAFERFHTAVQTFYVEEDDLNIIGLPTVEQIKLTLQG